VAKLETPRILFRRAAVDTRDAQSLERDALRVQHPEDVVIGRHEELRRIGKGRVLGEPARIGVAMRTDDRQIADAFVEIAGEPTRRRVRRKQPIFVQQSHLSSPFAADCPIRLSSE
jgi:hypothetical protein